MKTLINNQDQLNGKNLTIALQLLKNQLVTIIGYEMRSDVDYITFHYVPMNSKVKQVAKINKNIIFRMLNVYYEINQ